MGMTMTQKVLAAHAGLPAVKAGQLIKAKLDLVLGNDITSPVAINEFNKAGFDQMIVEASVKQTGAVVTAEEHSVIGGLGAAVLDVMAERDCYAPLVKVGIQDCFTESGAYPALLKKYQVDAGSVIKAAREAVKRKGKPINLLSVPSVSQRVSNSSFVIPSPSSRNTSRLLHRRKSISNLSAYASCAFFISSLIAVGIPAICCRPNKSRALARVLNCAIVFQCFYRFT